MYVAPKSPKGGSKMQNSCFRFKIALRLKKVCIKLQQSFCVKTVSDKVVGNVREYAFYVFSDFKKRDFLRFLNGYKSPKGGSKRKTAVFPLKSHFA